MLASKDGADESAIRHFIGADLPPHGSRNGNSAPSASERWAADQAMKGMIGPGSISAWAASHKKNPNLTGEMLPEHPIHEPLNYDPIVAGITSEDEAAVDKAVSEVLGRK